jgi:hypothetical protein
MHDLLLSSSSFVPFQLVRRTIQFFLRIFIGDSSLQQVKEMKDKAMSTLSSYMLEDFGDDAMVSSRELALATNQPFISLLELVSEIYQVRHFFLQFFSMSLFALLKILSEESII